MGLFSSKPVPPPQLILLAGLSGVGKSHAVLSAMGSPVGVLGQSTGGHRWRTATERTRMDEHTTILEIGGGLRETWSKYVPPDDTIHCIFFAVNASQPATLPDAASYLAELAAALPNAAVAVLCLRLPEPPAPIELAELDLRLTMAIRARDAALQDSLSEDSPAVLAASHNITAALAAQDAAATRRARTIATIEAALSLQRLRGGQREIPVCTSLYDAMLWFESYVRED